MMTGRRADFLVVANRLPVDLELLDDGTERWRQSPGGLVSALEPILRARNGAWIGWSGQADQDLDSFDDDGLVMHPVRLSSDEVRDYYEGFSNATLWPLYHDVVVPPVFERSWWESYVEVNQRFADAAAAAAAPGATVWVQDYQLQLVPAMLREQRPDLRIGFFLHIPFPPVELFMQLPWRKELVRGLLGADVVGFQMPGGAQNFLWLTRRLLDLEPSKAAVRVGNRPGSVSFDGRQVRVGAFPISIDAASFDKLSRRSDTLERARQIRSDVGNPHRVLLGVDRLDYTKGIDVRLRALRELLVSGRVDPESVTMIQLATPSRERVDQYKAMRRSIEQQVGRLNGEFGRVGRPIVHYLHQPVGREELVALYQAADVMVVTPLRDGMNLVCKEYVASRHDLDGVLVLSEFAGAAAELTSSLRVNPHDLDSVANALEQALTMDSAEQRERMRTARRQVMTNDVDRWARSFLDFLEPVPAAPEAATVKEVPGATALTGALTKLGAASLIKPAAINDGMAKPAA
ncbi:Alpha,alpha-trehalose-phosphate synthase (UDP- forming) [Catenulispora acidiphila DSM 44928]|uniref:Alpha,alpha-trehalose-phosphate synthase (UDP-forming) n=1 Tax=Catenulispora acidiphila (strain DSM 44928 / JCM 14897 / NBRC 102108 / NRRL B-24433 / ID139908) TaxID=479433 RepID=C7PZA3_CATAD|nr:trehalose-6-phosphate synthase [Catenulispora acidiphila]ACU71560.1 Alpha,alpha-trehalose-phosphate synthase (UDP- forming) [Catenulispora acidiphila DSM 44928]